jgi:O-antigen ligase
LEAGRHGPTTESADLPFSAWPWQPDDNAPRAARWADLAIGLGLALAIMALPYENNSALARRVGVGLALLGTVVALMRGWIDRSRVAWLLWPAGVMVAGWVVAVVASLDPAYSWKVFHRQHLVFLGLLVAAAAWARGAARQLFLVRAMALSLAVASALGIVFFHFAPALQSRGVIAAASDFVYTTVDGSGLASHRARGMLESYTRSSMATLFGLQAALVVVVLAARGGRRVELVAGLVAALLCAWFLLLTKARASWLGMGVLVLALGLLLRVRWWWIALTALLPMALVVATPRTRERALTLIEHASDPDLLLSNRLTLWRQGIDPIAAHPWTGLGLGGDIFLRPAVLPYFELYTDRRQPDLHNLYFQTLAEVGIVGLVGYAVFWCTVVMAIVVSVRRRGAPEESPALLYAAPLVATFALLGVVYYFNEEQVGCLAWMTAGLALSARCAGARSTAPSGR